ncbi:MAG: carboxypeptidase regulatory-like domain-containing protein [Planctomycetota bacterium]
MKNIVKAMILAVILAGLAILAFVFMNSGQSHFEPDRGRSDDPSGVAASDPTPEVKGPPVPPVEPAKLLQVTGTVKDDAGKPLAGVEITVNSNVQAGGASPKTREATTQSGDNGAFAVSGLRAGKYEFIARKMGYQEGRVTRTFADGTVEPVHFVLTAGLTISGYVKDSGGKPVPGARVGGFLEHSKKNASLEEQLISLIHIQEIQSEKGVWAEANADGWYQLTGLELRDYRVRAAGSQLAPAELRHVPAGTTDANFFLEPGGVLGGLVISQAGGPIEGAEILAYPSPPESTTVSIMDTVLAAIMPPFARAVSDRSGRYQFTEIGGGEQFRLIARAPRHQEYQADKVVVMPGVNTELNLTLETGLIVRGVVFDPDGRLLAGATVKVNQQGARPKANQIQDEGKKTGDDGRFEFDELGPGSYRLVASHPDFASVQENKVEPSEEDVELRLTVGGAIAGTITDAGTGAPVAGATIMVRDVAGIEKESVSDSSGRYFVRGIAVPARNKPVPLSVEAKHYARLANEQVPVEEAVTSEGYDFALERNGTVSGVVRDAAGKPVAGCKVSVKRQQSPTTPIVVSVGMVAISDASGNFVVEEVAPGVENFLEGSHSEYLSGDSGKFDLATGESLTGQILVMQRGGSISGTVVDEMGAPIANALVGVQGDYQGDMPIIGMPKHARTDETGSFFLASLEAETHTLVAEADQYLRTRLSGVDVVEDHTSQSIRITLVKSSYVAGFVTDTRNEPIANVKVTVTDNSAGLRRIAVHTDNNGSFRCDSLGPYEVDIMAEAPGFTTANLYAQPVNRDGLHLVLDRMGSIRGAVVDDTGKVVPAFSVSPKLHMDGRTQAKVPSKTFQPTDGRFEYFGIEPGDYEVTVGAPGYSIEIVDGIRVASDQSADIGTIVLRQGGKLGGRVVDAVTGEGVYAAVVTVLGGERNMLPQVPAIGQPSSRRPAGRGDTARTDREGNFLIEGLNVDGVSIRIEHREFMVYTEHNLSAGSTDLVFQLDRGGVIEGRVINSNGEELSGRQILMTGEGRNDRQVSDRKGSFTFSGLPSGQYILRATQIFMKGEDTEQARKERARSPAESPAKEVIVQVGETSFVEFVVE